MDQRNELPSSSATAWPNGRDTDSKVGTRRLSRSDAVDALADRLATEMERHWFEGRRPRTEEFLARHPEVGLNPRAAARLIYEEICLREALGDDSAAAEVTGRFPQWREELEILLDCHSLARAAPIAPDFPEVNETLGEYRLLALLGRGMLGRVFLAVQSSLGDRPVVLKVTKRSGGEHLSMARMQHPNIMPIYAAHDFPALDLRALCMPYLGGATLARVFELLAQRPPAHRTGADLVAVLDRVRTDLVALPAWSSTRQFLAGATYSRAVCWVGACLAEALHYAHERGLLHLDLKPSNILLADDGQPMLLDFHLSRAPMCPGGGRYERLGGTRGYMSPEQAAAMEAIGAGRPIPTAVDGRSDVYSLGVMLHEALVGSLPPDSGLTESLVLRSAQHVPRGLGAILAKSLATSPDDRYPDAAGFAAALRRHLEKSPLRGLADRGQLLRWLAWGRTPQFRP